MKSNSIENLDYVRRVTVIAVCFNSNDILPEMLASVPDGIAVILIDNGSANVASLRSVAESYGAELIRNDINCGFGVACNQGAEFVKTEFVMFLNPDARLQPDTLKILVDFADRLPLVSAMNPRLVNESGRASFQRRSWLVERSKWMARGWPPNDVEVPVLSGAALFVRKEAFDSVGGFDPNIFLYHEDDDLSVRLAADAGPIYFVRDACVLHLGGKSSSRSSSNASLKAWHMGRSRVYTMKKHGRQFARLQPILFALLQVLSPLVLFSRRKRSKQVGFLKGVMSAVMKH